MRDLQRPVWHGVRSTPQNVHPRAALWTIPEAPAAYSDDSALLFRRKAPGSSEGFGPGFPSDCGHVFRVNRPFCTGRIGA